MKIINKILFFLIFCTPLYCFAWGTEGHRVTGEIASRHLSKKASAAIASLLGNETIAIASNWADFIKSDSTYKYLDEWHYIDLPDSLHQQGVDSYLSSDTAADVYTKINFLSAQLKNKNLPKEKKVFYLRLLIHLVEDLHEPLHTIGRDDGGNKIKVLWFNNPSNLHTIWDSELILSQQFSYTEYANYLDHANKQQIENWQSGTLRDWIYESYNIGESIVNEIKQPNQKLSYRYNFDHIATLNEQLLKGGIRLAKVLNTIFG